MTHQRFGRIGCVVVWLSMVSPAPAAEVALTVSTPSSAAEGGMAQTRLRMGVVAGATAGFDTQWDVPAPPAPSNGTVALSASIVPSALFPDQPLLWDFRGETFPQTWTLDVTSDQTAPVTLGWQVSGSANACGSTTWTLEDMYGGTRVDLNAASSQGYQFIGQTPRTRRFIVTAEAPLAQQPPPAPRNLWSPRQGRASVYLAWAGIGTASVRYHVYRETSGGPARLTSTPIATTSYVDTGVDRTTTVTYRVTAVAASGCESDNSAALTLAPHR